MELVFLLLGVMIASAFWALLTGSISEYKVTDWTVCEKCNNLKLGPCR